MPLLSEHKNNIPRSLYILMCGSGIESVEDVVFNSAGNLTNRMQRWYNSELQNNESVVALQNQDERVVSVQEEETDNNGKYSIKSLPSNFNFNMNIVKKQVYILQEYLLGRYAPKSVSVEQMALNDGKIRVSGLNTGSGQLDSLLDGGIQCGELTEIVGFQSSGKTCLCKTVSLNTIIEKNSDTVLWISTNSSFNAREFAMMYESKSNLYNEQIRQSQATQQSQVEADEICSLVETFTKIRVLDVSTPEELKTLLIELVKLIESEQDNFYNSLRLVVIDSLAVILTSLVQSKVNSKISEKEDLSLDEIIRLMKKIARKYQIAFLYTNYTLHELDDRTVLGETCKYFSHVRLLSKKLEKQPPKEEGTFFEAHLLKSPRRSLIHPSVYFQVMSLGVVDTGNTQIPNQN
ncbi:predicted protein [Naegleria gruberi]|uniref:Predicted protein n=1 Tax=Naegleria gruberi TaxID=5762 RepID=D2UYS0_NAEGR|nr:uncharacterized protein NAEGRDRAFT_45247 [Naegleria gruberi]EFC50836.1 predicted protein [Naegleria gruberi]|eukprot:XP_002683580.1 predicted protein [Naegleria gruberi strain NEG-M]